MVKLVKAVEVLEHLSADTKLVTPEKREEALEHRRASYLKMFNEINQYRQLCHGLVLSRAMVRL